jgi:hypothetical protein
VSRRPICQRCCGSPSISERAACGTEIEERLAVEAKERQRQNAKATTRERVEKRADLTEGTKVEIVPPSSNPRPTPEPKARDQAAKLIGTYPG